jgi:phosphoribosylanthranilate isomerase
VSGREGRASARQVGQAADESAGQGRHSSGGGPLAFLPRSPLRCTDRRANCRRRKRRHGVIAFPRRLFDRTLALSEGFYYTPRRIRVKMCGNRSPADLDIVCTSGADAVGIISGVTHFSEDELEPDAARQLSQSAMSFPYVSRVLVTHLLDPAEIVRLAEHVDVDAIQLHGENDVSVTREVKRLAHGKRITQAVHVTGDGAVDRASEFARYCDVLLLDSRTSDRLGGTGLTHDWEISRRIVDEMRLLGRWTVLAGGLNPDNVLEAVRAVRPYAVDVNSGVDDKHGDKSLERASAFVHAVSLAAPVAV